jgi:hypothetical protein
MNLDSTPSTDAERVKAVLICIAMPFVFWGLLRATSFLPGPPLPPLFKTEVEAQRHCPDDTVVWIHLGRGIWYQQKGMFDYGNIGGRFGCKREADAVRIHADSR